MKTKIYLIIFIVLKYIYISAAQTDAGKGKYVYGTAAMPWAESFGNHRAVLEVPKAASVVSLDMEWRRPDKSPESRRFLLVNAETGDTIPNVKKVKVDNEECRILFGPVSEAGTYYFYYLPYTVQKGYGAYYGDYLPDSPVLQSNWDALTGQPEEAEVVRIESRTAFDSFYPMEVIATEAETEAYRKTCSQAFYLFPEDRKYPIRMKHYLPQRWMEHKQGEIFRGGAQPNEYYAFQIGVWSPDAVLGGLTYEATDLVSGQARIPASAITCFNTEGINVQGKPFRKQITVARDSVQPLWFGVDIPQNVQLGTYTGTITIKSEQGEQKQEIAICIEGDVLADRGDNEPWRHSRLRWLNSTLGEADEVTRPYEAVQFRNSVFSCLGREVALEKESLLPKQVTAWDTPVLESPVRFVVETAEGIKHYEARYQLEEQASTHVSAVWKAGDEDMDIACTVRMEFDGWMNYVYSIIPKRELQIKDIRLELPVKNSVGSYFLGAGLPGQDTPAYYDGKWNTPVTTVDNHGVSIPVNKQANWLWPFDSFWIGNAHAGIHCELRGSNYSGPLLNAYRPAYPKSWDNEGKGGFRIQQEKEQTLVTVYSGERHLQASDTVRFDFALTVTPVKPLNSKSQFEDHYYHNGAAPRPTDEDVQAGVKIINIHHANKYNPYINYPFLVTDTLKPFIREWHQKGCKVKLYYTLRELTSAFPELWAIRSLGTEILRGGDGGGFPWCREHLVSGYTPQWYQHFDGNDMPITADAALLTTEDNSRWYNYYIEGLRWMVKNLDIDGIYLDDVSFGRDILQRMRRAMDEVKPGCIIDLHSNTGFSKGPANQYMEFFPYVDKIWFGESFIYDKMTPANWLVESSGIPYGLMGDMLHRGGNKWLGMQYGMTVRHPWFTEGVICDPRPIWKIWDEFGIADSRMIGYWEKDVPVKATDDAVKVTVYEKDNRLLLSIGNYTDEVKRVRLVFDKKKLKGVNLSEPLVAPEISTFQEHKTWTMGDEIEVAPRKGWLIYVGRR